MALLWQVLLWAILFGSIEQRVETHPWWRVREVVLPRSAALPDCRRCVAASSLRVASGAGSLLVGEIGILALDFWRVTVRLMVRTPVRKLTEHVWHKVEQSLYSCALSSWGVSISSLTFCLEISQNTEIRENPWR